jgi:hypothetical protein
MLTLLLESEVELVLQLRMIMGYAATPARPFAHQFLIVLDRLDNLASRREK